MDAPADNDYARGVWPDAGNLPDDVLTSLLTLSWEACESYVPADELVRVAPPGTDPAPERWRMANVLHARDAWTATRRDTGDVLGFDQYAVTVRPVSGTVRALLRPSRGVPMVG
jgi:hypothetical protein